MTSQVDLTNLLPAVIAAAEAAGRSVAAEFTRPGGPRGRGGHADVDDEIEAVLRQQLLEMLPARWWGEETGKHVGPGGPQSAPKYQQTRGEPWQPLMRK